MGSILFIVGATASALSPRFSNGWVDVHGADEFWRSPTSASGEEWEWEWKATILIQYAYLVGGTYFTVGVRAALARAARASGFTTRGLQRRPHIRNPLVVDLP